MLENCMQARKVVVTVADRTSEYGIQNTHYSENRKSKVEQIKIHNMTSTPVCEIIFEDGMKVYYFHPHIVSFHELSTL